MVTILSQTERWKHELDNHKVIGIVSKAFDTLPFDLMIEIKAISL